MRTSFLTYFITTFIITFLCISTIQEFRGNLRWYNESEESYERLQTDIRDITLTASTKDDHIVVNIAPKPVNSTSKASPTQKKYSSSISPSSTVKRVTTPVQITTQPEGLALSKEKQSTLQTVLEGAYFGSVLWAFPVIIDYDRTSPRGQMQNESITLADSISGLDEMAKVFVHELGHMVDIYALRATRTASDPSQAFYAISWESPTVMRPRMGQKDFISWYALTNQYEDFAEAFTMYIFHNSAFALRAEQSVALQKKYDFFHAHVFGTLFENSQYEKDEMPTSFWDVTKIALSKNALAKVFAFIQSFVEKIFG